MQALDLFCGAGGSAMGLHRAGFKQIAGIDIKLQPDYPFDFYQRDVIKDPLGTLANNDFIWASPPCQRYSEVNKGNTKRRRAARRLCPDLIGKTRDLLLATGKPFVIENVPGAPLRVDLTLCGTMFNLPLLRHRIFETHGFTVPQPEHKPHTISVMDGTAISVSRFSSPGCWGNKERRAEWKRMYSHLYTLENKSRAMGISHITTDAMLCEAVPPAYSEYIGRHFLKGRGGS